MRTDANNSEATAADAFQLISDEGIKRGGFRHRLAFRLRVPPWAISVAAVLVLLVVAAVSYRWFYPTLQKIPVAVLLPQIPDAGPEGREISSVEQNVRRQLEGFDRAWTENGIDSKSLERRLLSYSLPLNDVEAERLMPIIKDLYSDGVRTFIITLSGSALKLRGYFKLWVASMPDRHRPVLIATVASAPDIADIEHGIFRHYIRSEDESSVFSRYISLSSSEDSREVFLIHIDDPYGRQAKKTLVDSGIELSRVLPIRVEDNKIENYDSLIRSRIHPHAETEKHSYVIVVGYGAMVKNMVSKLINLESPQLAAGGASLAVDSVPRLEEVLVVSTFTESRWRPSDAVLRTAGDLRILTLGTDQEVDRREDRGVVYQFSFLTLDKAIKCSKQMHSRRGLKAFAKCWETLPAKGLAEQWMPTVELLANGDSHIPLRILEQADW